MNLVSLETERQVDQKFLVEMCDELREKILQGEVSDCVMLWRERSTGDLKSSQCVRSVCWSVGMLAWAQHYFLNKNT